MNTETTATSHVDPVPNDMRTVTPHLVCADAAGCIEFYKSAFGATELARLNTPDGKIMHACLRIGDSNVMLVDEMPEWEAFSPRTIGKTPITIHLQVPDAEALFAQAVEAGATVKMPLTDMFWGDRYGIVVDPSGHHWSIATHIKDLTLEEIQEAAASACCGGGPE